MKSKADWCRYSADTIWFIFCENKIRKKPKFKLISISCAKKNSPISIHRHHHQQHIATKYSKKWKREEEKSLGLYFSSSIWLPRRIVEYNENQKCSFSVVLSRSPVQRKIAKTHQTHVSKLCEAYPHAFFLSFSLCWWLSSQFVKSKQSKKSRTCQRIIIAEFLMNSFIKFNLIWTKVFVHSLERNWIFNVTTKKFHESANSLEKRT